MQPSGSTRWVCGSAPERACQATSTTARSGPVGGVSA